MATAAKKKERRSHQSPVGIATFTHLWEPYSMAPANKDDKPRPPMYSVLLVFDAAASKSPEMKALKQACYAAAEDKFGATARERIKKGKINMPWRDASDYEEYGEPFTDEGATMIMFKSNEAPGIVDRRAATIMDRKEIYSGCKMRVSFGIWPYDTAGNKGVTLLLNNVQKVADGKRLAGRMDAEEEFEEIEGDDEDDDLGI